MIRFPDAECSLGEQLEEGGSPNALRRCNRRGEMAIGVLKAVLLLNFVLMRRWASHRAILCCIIQHNCETLIIIIWLHKAP